MTTVLTVAGLDLGLDSRLNYMSRVCRGYAVAEGRTQLQVPIKSTLDPTGQRSIAQDAEALHDALLATPGPKVVLGYSRGAQVAGAWLRRYGTGYGPPPEELSFLLIGNPERRYGKPPWVKHYTPDWTSYRVRDVARTDDGWCNWDGSLRRSIGMLGSVHLQYWNTDPFGPDAVTVRSTATTDYVVAP